MSIDLSSVIPIQTHQQGPVCQKKCLWICHALVLHIILSRTQVFQLAFDDTNTEMKYVFPSFFVSLGGLLVHLDYKTLLYSQPNIYRNLYC